MLGYATTDLDEMISAIQSSLTTVNSDDDPWLYNNLWKAQEFLQGLWAEGYFDQWIPLPVPVAMRNQIKSQSTASSTILSVTTAVTVAVVRSDVTNVTPIQFANVSPNHYN